MNLTYNFPQILLTFEIEVLKAMAVKGKQKRGNCLFNVVNLFFCHIKK